MNALILVDIQNDFLPGGALAVDGGDQVVPVANAMMRRFKAAGDLVVATQDAHPADHLSFASQHAGRQVGDRIELDGLEQVLWPDHCVRGTTGAEFAPGLEVGWIDHVFPKGVDHAIDSYSGFFDNGHRKDTGLAEWLRQRGVSGVTIMGLATDICVKFTVLDARRLGFDVTVLLEGCRGVEMTRGDMAAAIDEMRAAGAKIDGVRST